ncbi:ribonuclease HII [Bacillus sp. RG28]|uniref:Ribonuclease HII n=1 Tax=Gottfriedia endophytica TaxID=2820819 RepID=A0A940SHJ5_9BACI|nr:ribonuclease HII [Gottfriedia endophytica]MBP0726257.1 ribonuclease HII [Gottfriedia endophytica]
MGYSIKELKEILETISDVNDETLRSIKMDERIGVQKLVAKWMKDQEKRKLALEKYKLMQAYEEDLINNGVTLIAGVDEVGRGPLAGPVVAAAVILKKDANLIGIDDSKKLSKGKRKFFFEQIKTEAVSYGIGICTSKEIDQHNIYEATKIAMERAISNLNPSPQHLLIDAMKLALPISQTSIIKGDANSISIAAASVLAKETRDAMMEELGEKYPEYGFEKHMGYGTKEHLNAIKEKGIIDEHRRSFAPIKEYS